MIAYGTRRPDVLVPSGNSVAETELRAMPPNEVTMLSTRLALRGSSDQELLAMLSDLDHAASLPGHAEPDAISFHCTSVSTFAPHLAEDIRGRITSATGRPTITTADACFISCTAIRSGGLIADLEASPGMPVITSNQVLVWPALHTPRVDRTVAGFGQLVQ